MSLDQLDAFLSLVRSDPDLAERLRGPVDLDTFLALAAAKGFPLDEADVLEAWQREEATLSSPELQQRHAGDVRRLQSFIGG
jgi:predicted ribosomally synthesized peptide with nif11-like leader